MAILITGGAGYIGSVTVELLASQNEQIVVLDNLGRGYRSAVGHLTHPHGYSTSTPSDSGGSLGSIAHDGLGSLARNPFGEISNCTFQTFAQLNGWLPPQ
jgi:NAD dependent epimerase/dehydratase family